MMIEFPILNGLVLLHNVHRLRIFYDMCNKKHAVKLSILKNFKFILLKCVIYKVFIFKYIISANTSTRVVIINLFTNENGKKFKFSGNRYVRIGITSPK